MYLSPMKIPPARDRDCVRADNFSGSSANERGFNAARQYLGTNQDCNRSDISFQENQRKKKQLPKELWEWKAGWMVGSLERGRERKEVAIRHGS